MAADLGIAVAGRDVVYRVGRCFVDRARLTVANDPGTNGEYLVQQALLKYAAGDTVDVFDVGANVGEWSLRLADQAGSGASRLRIHAFEPSASTFAMLKKRVEDLSHSAQIIPVQKACSETSGRANFYVVGAGAGTNSLSPTVAATAQVETVEVTKLDEYCEAAALNRIGMLKIDAEGHDLDVIGGARKMLTRRAIDLVQFEYNHRWIYPRKYLRDAFELLSPLGYVLGKIVPVGIEFYPAWDAELETFREDNFLACLPQWVGHFRVVAPAWNPNLLAGWERKLRELSACG